MAGIKKFFGDKMWGNKGHGPLPIDDLTDITRDAMYRYQMNQDNPLALTSESLVQSKICETYQYANSVFSSCQNAHVINSAGLPDTTRIDSSLVSKIAVISVPKQRELVNMLFFWEEEVTRLRLLQEEENEIEAAIREHGETDDLAMALKVVKGKRAILPSARLHDGTAKKEDDLPGYER